MKHYKVAFKGKTFIVHYSRMNNKWRISHEGKCLGMFNALVVPFALAKQIIKKRKG